MKAMTTSLKNFVTQLKTKGRKCTLLGVGPVSKIVVKAAFEASKRYSCPPIFVASRNQVDLKSFGHGYLMGGMDQRAFVDLIEHTQQATGYDGPVYICRDHGGPWQRNIELGEKYPVDTAMEIARKSFKADIQAGFNYLHIDPTKCPHPFSQDDLCVWTVCLIEYCEHERKRLRRPPIDYEVGTEDIQGGLTTNDTFDSFLKTLVKSLDQKHLPLPTCVVGQTGTLCRVDHNVGHFDRKQTAELADIASRYGIGLKEHNGDYMGAASCRIHPDIGVTGMNVAPEFGLVETDACLHLADLEMKLLQDNWITVQTFSNLRQILLEKTFTQTPWTKWTTDEIKQVPNTQIESDTAIRLLIARVCGHYVYDSPEILQARKKLYDNINHFEIVDNAEQFIVDRVRDSIEFYMKHFRLEQVNSFLDT